MKLLVTGSSGQVGTNLCLALLERGDTVLGIDRNPNPWTAEIPYLQRDIATERMPSLAELAFRPDVVVHLAANAKVHELVENPRRAHENATTAFEVAEFCRLNNLPLIFSSSREVYGNAEPPAVPETAIDAFHVCSPYAAYKLADEMLIYSYANCYDLNYIIFRLSNVYGRYDNDLHRMTRVIHIFIDQMRRGEPITIFNRHKLIDFTYIDDCVAAFLLGIDNLVAGNVRNETFNLSSGSPATLERLAFRIAECLHVTPEIIDEPTQPGEIDFYIADLSHIKQELGYQPRTTFDEGIQQAVNWSLSWQESH